MSICGELENLNNYIKECVWDKNNYIAQEIYSYLTLKSKRLRPYLIFLFAKSFEIEITEKIYHLACAVELIHNSTLIHDDIIDNSDIRRGKISLNRKLGNNLSVLSGDFLLSLALKELVKCHEINIISLFSKSMYLMCKGEINQSLTKDKILSLSEYIEKSEYKTAELFKASLASLSLFSDKFQIDKLSLFAKNFGIAFQIKDDLINIMQTDKTKPSLSDIYNGIYTAPVIFLNEDKTNIENIEKDKIEELLKSDKKYIHKTVSLIEKYAKRAIETIDFIEDNIYKQEIITITENLYKADIYE